jgi:hypothetical protein
MIRTAWMIPIVATFASPTQAGPCTEGIARLEAEVRAVQNLPDDGPSAPQSVGAQMEHQPTPESVTRAKRQARAGFVSILARAKKLDTQNDPACADVLAEARLVYFE